MSRTVALVGAHVLVVATACGTDQPRLEVVTHDGVTALIDTRRDGGMEAQVVGELVLGPGGCLALVGWTGDGSVPLVWPRGTDLAADGQSITVDGTTLRIGDRVDGGGGEVTVTGSGYTEVPDACLGDDDLVVAITQYGN